VTSEVFHYFLRACLFVSMVLLAGAVGAYVLGAYANGQLLLMAGLTAFAIGLSSVPALRTLTFTAWIVAAVVTAMFAPQVFQPFEPRSRSYNLLFLVLIQAVMFGMGTQMRISDFVGVVRSPLPVAIGLFCQCTIMPLLGFGLAIAFQLPPEIAAGLVLIGACSSGLASNVMTYIAGADLALSITLSAVGTFIAPLVTPFWMKVLAAPFLAETDVTISFVEMMVSIVKIVLVPTGAALVHDYLLRASQRGRMVVWITAIAGAIYASAFVGGSLQTPPGAGIWMELAAWVLSGVAFGLAYHLAVTATPQLADAMPAVSMAGIIYVTGMTSAEGRDNLLSVGAVLVMAVALHNLLGYALGYGMGRLLGMNEQVSRTIALEVGMQNGGMATGIAADMGKLSTLGLPAAIFIAWMNVTGSLLANYWRRRPPVVVETNAGAVV